MVPSLLGFPIASIRLVGLSWSHYLWGLHWVSLVFLGCTQTASEEPIVSLPESVPQVLQNMPLNSERRCVGIAGVVEAIAEAKLEESVTPLETCAENIYQHLLAKQALRLPNQIEWEKKTIPIESKAAIDQLGTLVADKFKRHHERLLETEAGAIRIIIARSDFLTSQAKMNALIREDRDGLVFIAGDGWRTFPDGEVKETNHAFLVKRLADGSYVVFDPNDPGRAIELKLRTENNLLVLEWTGKYRDTGKITTQRYHVVDAKKCLAAYDESNAGK